MRKRARVRPSLERSVDEMIGVLEATTYEVVACRLVGHMTTTSGTPVEIGQATVVPEPQDRQPPEDPVLGRVLDEIPGPRPASTASFRECTTRPTRS